MRCRSVANRKRVAKEAIAPSLSGPRVQSPRISLYLMHDLGIWDIDDISAKVSAIVFGSTSELLSRRILEPLLAARTIHSKEIRPAHDLNRYVASTIVCEIACRIPTIAINEWTSGVRAVPKLHEAPSPYQACGL